MTDSTTITAWMNGYLRAWDSNDPADIAALFTDDGEYLTAPYATPRRGVDAIVAGWIEDQDQPGDYTFTWSEAGVDGDLAFVTGETRYSDGRTYANLWVIRFAADGRASSFTEWYMRHPDA
ncbi:MAG: nuclear transport factor 2 family protein [Schumannella sp.]